MPFDANEFLDVFAAYNWAVWPWAVSLWALTAVAGATLISGAVRWTQQYAVLLAGHWIWAGAVYHAVFFTSINPAAWLFAALFVAQGVMFLVVRLPDGSFVHHPAPARRLISAVLVLYGLMYPAVAWADGFDYPRMPTFGVPCPTALVTIGFLVAAPARSVLLSIVPVAWSLIGATAVWLFAMHADLVLPAAGTVLVADLIFGRSHVMRKMSFAAPFVLLVATLIFLPASSAWAQAPQHDHQQQAQKGATKMDGMKMDGMKMDGKMMEEMAAKKKANAERINALMATVKSATGEAKVAAMADVVAVLIEERAAMQEHCAKMMKMMKK